MRRLADLLLVMLLLLALPAPRAKGHPYRGLTRRAVERALDGYPLVRIASESDGRGGLLTVAEGVKIGDPPLMVFGVWDGTHHVRIASGWDATFALLGRGRLAIRFNVGQPNAYAILYHWNGTSLVASQPENGLSPPNLLTLTPEPATASVGSPVTLVVDHAPGPVTFTCNCSGDASIAGSEFVAEAPGTYIVTARSGFWQTTAVVTVVAPASTGSSAPPSTGSGNVGLPASPAFGGMVVDTPTLQVGGTLDASLPVSGGTVFWWVTNTVTGMEYPLFGATSPSLDATLPPVIPPGSYTLAAQVNAPGEAPITFTAPITITGAPTALFSGSVTPYDIYNWQNVLPLFRQGIEGQGETIALFELSDPNLADVEAFDGYMGLPPADIRIVAPYGDPGITDAVDEADLDVEWAHAMAPYATIVVYAYSRLSEMLGSLSLATLAALHAGDAAISISYGWPNLGLAHLATDLVFADAAHHGLGIFASSGDHGQDSLLNWSWPSTDLDVVSVGGIQYDSQGRPSYWYSGYGYGNELWAGGYGKTLGLAPSWQVALGLGDERMIPDVSELANNAFVVLDGTLTTSGGTSLASPMWAAIWALVLQRYEADHLGFRPSLPAGELLYDAAFYGPKPAFSQGYDARTGFGPPDVANLAYDIDQLP